MTNISSLLDKLRANSAIIATAESCTGGMIAAAITDIAGSSEIFDRGFVTYSNQAKMDMLGVSKETLDKHGAVSHQTCEEMLRGAIANSNASVAIATTGIAGPSGGSAEKPVGLVYIGVMYNEKIRITKNIIKGNRKQVRDTTVEKAIALACSFF